MATASIRMSPRCFLARFSGNCRSYLFLFLFSIIVCPKEFLGKITQLAFEANGAGHWLRDRKKATKIILTNQKRPFDERRH